VKPLCIDLYCGLGGWTEGFLSEGYDVVGFDIERHQYGNQKYPAQLVLQDVLTLHGSQFKDAAVIVSSPPCQKYSYMAMPWTRAKALAAWYRESPERIKELNALFDTCFRIQREASEAAGRHIPMVVENVKGAQPWVGMAAWHYGSFYLWGDIPALMPFTNSMKMGRAPKAPNGVTRRFTNPSEWQDGDVWEYGVKVPSMTSWDGYGKPGYRPQGFNVTVAQRYREAQGVKQNGSVPEWFDKGIGKHSSRSDSRKAASAQIAKIPFSLSSHIARCIKPEREADSG
jgi:hypothetical protein